MYSQSDIDEAVAAGAIPAAEAASLQAFVERRDGQPGVDGEAFRLITSFNDVFVTIALILCFVAIGGLTREAAMLAIPAFAWAVSPWLIERRRMALPSIVIALSFAFMSYGAGLMVGRNAVAGAVVGALAAAAHYYRFRVPITVAVITGLATSVVLHFCAESGIAGGKSMLVPTLLCGLAVFALAMRYDLSDRHRRTRRSDVAFWLHLQGSALTIHSFFWLSGLLAVRMSPAASIAVLLIYVALIIVALAIDRRAVLVSAMAYALWAVGNLLFQQRGAGLTIPLTALVIGSGLLMLAAFWSRARALLVGALPPRWRAWLPALDEPFTPRPAAAAAARAGPTPP